MTQSLTLYSIEAELQQLIDARILAEEDGALPDELAVIDKLLAEYMAREVRKVDGIAHAVRAFQNAAVEAQNEARRINERAKHLEAQANRIKAAALAAMQAHGITRLETPTNRLRIQTNGGVQPLEIHEVHMLAGGLQRTTITITGDAYTWLWEIFEDRNIPMHPLLKLALTNPKWEPDTERIREALTKFVPCPECHKDGIPSAKQLVECQRCGSRGAVPATVPGARLLERGFHLRVE